MHYIITKHFGPDSDGAQNANLPLMPTTTAQTLQIRGQTLGIFREFE
jgi:hypothetical protein